MLIGKTGGARSQDPSHWSSSSAGSLLLSLTLLLPVTGTLQKERPPSLHPGVPLDWGPPWTSVGCCAAHPATPRLVLNLLQTSLLGALLRIQLQLRRGGQQEGQSTGEGVSSTRVQQTALEKT